jgi:hypothetical protein
MSKFVLYALLALATFTGSASAATAGPSIAGGKFEVTCKPHSIPDQAIDPIVSPGVASAHEHTFFGSKGLTNTSTPASLQASTAGTTCVLPQDTAAYWLPVACNGPCTNAITPTNVVQPVKIFGYYFGTKGVAVGQYPANLQMVGGNAHATTPPTTKQMIEFSCGNGGSHHSPVRTYPYDCTAANGVSGTDGVVAVVLFPYCQDSLGVVGYGGSTGACPTGSTTLGQVQIHVHYGSNTSGFQTGSKLNFTSGPYYTFHGDWMNGWKQTKLHSLVSGCLDINKDCGFLTTSNPGP